MKFSHAQKILKVSRPTLLDLIKQGKIKANKVRNRWDVDRKSTYDFLEKNRNRKFIRKIFGYSRSLKKGESETSWQKDMISDYCIRNELQLDSVFSDVGNALDLNRKNLLIMLEKIMELKVEKVVIAHENIIGKIHANFIKEFFKLFDVELIIVDVNESLATEQEVLEESTYLLEIYMNNAYSKRRKTFWGELIERIRKEAE